MIVEEHLRLLRDKLGEFIADGFIRETLGGRGWMGQTGKKSVESEYWKT